GSPNVAMPRPSRRSCGVVTATVAGTVVGATVVGTTVVGATVVGATVVGATVVGATVVGTELGAGVAVRFGAVVCVVGSNEVGVTEGRAVLAELLVEEIVFGVHRASSVPGEVVFVGVRRAASVWRARLRWLFTVPSRQPRISATRAGGRSST